MKGKIFLVITIAVILFSLISLVVVLGRARQGQQGVAKESRPAAANSQLITQGEQYENEGKYVEAKSVYSKLLEESKDNEIITQAEKKLYDLNIRILFSPVITPDSQKYKVVEGDTLTKIAKEFNTTTELLMRSNNLANDRIRPGMELKVSLAKYSIMVDKSLNILMLKANDEILKTYSISTGINNCTPIGQFTIVNKLLNPTWYSAGAVVPAGSPENILGSRWMGLSVARYGIHGTTDPESVGKQITAGCVRMRNKNVEELYAIVPVGTEVTIVD